MIESKLEIGELDLILRLARERSGAIFCWIFLVRFANRLMGYLSRRTLRGRRMNIAVVPMIVERLIGASLIAAAPRRRCV